MLRATSLLLVSILLCGCGSTSSSGATDSENALDGRHSQEEGEPTRVSFVDYRTGVRMTLVNEAHSDPVELYSEVRTRATANIKVISNEVMTAMIDHFDDQGFNTWAQRGYAPARGRQGELQSFEVETPGTTSFLVTTGGKDAAAETFRECRTAFLQVQQLTRQVQAVTNDGSEVIFEQPRPDEKTRKR
jgi:hypothetical protein